MPIRRCLVCEQPIEHLGPRRVSCGHPRCQRTIRSGKLTRGKRKETESVTPREAAEERAKWDEDEVRREAIARVKFAKARGASHTQAVLWTSQKMGLPVKDILSIAAAIK